MNQDLIKRLATDLEALLWRYANQEAEAASLLKELEPIIREAKSGNIIVPLEDVPGAWLFIEGKLRKYSDLEDVYAQFKIQVVEAENPTFKRIRDEFFRRKAEREKT
ncbi:hypothetical protein [Nitrospirillum amazonense]|uniref:hypothetical protein n=1 Tax=Nitrospirillum amazonense TaxID=28077 RepID=UPI0011A364DD|nr:hypothetical protein [Nitrospirillum amazonense]MDG3443699.1 hypothetical protein [Nitrospirillum amazonense]